MSLHYRFGPFAFTVEGTSSSHPLLEPFAISQPSSAFGVTIGAPKGPFGEASTVALALAEGGEELVGPGFRATPGPAPAGQQSAHAQASLDPAVGTHGFPLLALLSALVLRAAARAHLVVLHAGGLRVAGGVALLAGRAGVGKSTWLAQFSDRVFAYNATLIDPERGWAWPLPFTGKEDPPLTRIEGASVHSIYVGGRDPSEPSERPPAVELLSHVATLEGDPMRIDCLCAAMVFFRKTACMRFKLTDPDPTGAMIDFDSDSKFGAKDLAR